MPRTNGFDASDQGLERGCSAAENHLLRYISTGEVALEDLVPSEKLGAIKQAILATPDSQALSPIKEKLGDEYSYGEIRAVIAAMEAGLLIVE